MLIDNRGIILDKIVDFDFLKSVEPRYFPDFIKFVVDLITKEVAIGMELHASNLLKGNRENQRGGNIYFVDKHIEYSSTLNVQCNLTLRKNKKHKDFNVNPRIITDEDIINEINNILYVFVKI
jgi:hypothetical protein